MLLEVQSFEIELDNYGKINGNCVTNVFIIHEPIFSGLSLLCEELYTAWFN